MSPTKDTRQALLQDLQNLSEELGELAKRVQPGKRHASGAVLEQQIDMLSMLEEFPVQTASSLVEQIDLMGQLIESTVTTDGVEATDMVAINAQLGDLLQVLDTLAPAANDSQSVDQALER